MPLKGASCRKWVSEFPDPFESLFLSHIIYYRVYLQVFICRKWVIFPCINADPWEKDVQLHFVSGTKFYDKNICHIVWVYRAWRLSIYFFFLLLFRIWRPAYLFIYLRGDVGQDIYFQLYPGPDIYLQKKTASPSPPNPPPEIYVHSLNMLDFSPTPK